MAQVDLSSESDQSVCWPFLMMLSSDRCPCVAIGCAKLAGAHVIPDQSCLRAHLPSVNGGEFAQRHTHQPAAVRLGNRA